MRAAAIVQSRVRSGPRSPKLRGLFTSGGPLRSSKAAWITRVSDRSWSNWWPKWPAGPAFPPRRRRQRPGRPALVENSAPTQWTQCACASPEEEELSPAAVRSERSQEGEASGGLSEVRQDAERSAPPERVLPPPATHDDA